ncbi:MAG: hypothetical protein Q9P01_10460 [Anaerolineae bacterium]|nr:hypothetical protein [Anaerolineae bacterium]
MAKWEYLIVFVYDSKVAEDNKDIDVFLDADTFTDKLNKYGEAGWELVTFEWEKTGQKRLSSAHVNKHL